MRRLRERCPVRRWLSTYDAADVRLARASARGAYAELALVYAAVFGASVVSSVATACWQFQMISTPVTLDVVRWSADANIWGALGGWLAVLVLAYRTIAGDRGGRVSPWSDRTARTWRWAMHVLTVLSVAAGVWMGWHARQLSAGDLSWRLPKLTVALALVGLVAYRRGLRPADLGLRRTRDRQDAAVARRVYANSFMAMAADSVLCSVILFVLEGVDRSPVLAARLSVLVHRPAPRLSAGSLVHMLAEQVANAAYEETVVTVAVVLALRAAGRPMREILAVACALRVGYHLYYNLAGLGMVIFTAVNVLIYDRTRRILPLIAAHAVWDTAGFLAPVAGSLALSLGPLHLHAGWVLAAGLLLPPLAHQAYIRRRHREPAAGQRALPAPGGAVEEQPA